MGARLWRLWHLSYRCQWRSFATAATPGSSRYFKPDESRTIAQRILGEVMEAKRSRKRVDQVLGLYVGALTPEIAGRVMHELSDPGLAWEFFQWAGSQYGFVHTTFTCNVLLNVYVKARRMEDAYRFFKKQMPEFGEPDEITYNTMMNGFFKVGEIRKALALFDEMRDNGIAVLRSHNIVLKGLCLAGRFSLAWDIFRDMSGTLSPNLVTFTTMIDGLCKNREVDKAFALLGQMQDKGIYPDVVTYGALLDGLCKERRIKEAYEMFEEASAKGCHPNVIVYNVLIDGLSKNGRVSDALKLYDFMVKNEGLVPDVFTYSVLIDGLCKSRNVAEAYEVFTNMLEKGITPDVVIYNALLDGLCKWGYENDAMKLYKKLIADENCEPDLITYTVMVDGLCKVGKLDDALKFMKEMVGKGIVPDSLMYNTVIAALCKESRIYEAHLLFENMHKACRPDAVLYNTLIDGYCKAGRMDDAKRIHDKMMDHGCAPTLATYNALITGFCRAGRPDESQLLYHEMIEMGFKPESHLSMLIDSTKKKDGPRPRPYYLN